MLCTFSFSGVFIFHFILYLYFLSTALYFFILDVLRYGEGVCFYCEKGPCYVDFGADKINAVHIGT